MAQSGQRYHSWLSKAGPAPLRRHLYLAAGVAARHDPDLAAFVDQLVARGKPKQVARCAAMHKLLCQMMGRLRHYYRDQAALASPLVA